MSTQTGTHADDALELHASALAHGADLDEPAGSLRSPAACTNTVKPVRIDVAI